MAGAGHLVLPAGIMQARNYDRLQYFFASARSGRNTMGKFRLDTGKLCRKGFYACMPDARMVNYNYSAVGVSADSLVRSLERSNGKQVNNEED